MKEQVQKKIDKINLALFMGSKVYLVDGLELSSVDLDQGVRYTPVDNNYNSYHVSYSRFLEEEFTCYNQGATIC